MPKSRTQLSWKPGYSLTRQPVKKAPSSQKRRATCVNSDGTREFEFIYENTIDYYDPRATPDTTTQTGTLPTDKSSSSGTSIRHNSGDSAVLHRGQFKHYTYDLIHYSQRSAIIQPSSVLYIDLLHQYEPILLRYNEEFCKIPLTTDLSLNPFQYQKIAKREPAFLVHAAMALAGHHLESFSTHHHRQASLQALRESLSDRDFSQAQHMVDAIILLFSLDETQSAFGTWATHLKGAYALLESCRSINQWQVSKRLVVQVGMLTWWDAILNLVNREDCVFPIAYFERIAAIHDEKEWDYFGLCGCPLPIVKHVMRLARLGAKKRHSVEDKLSDADMIEEIQKSLETWQYTSCTIADDEESMQRDQDRMHCSEAWRNGLLLYIYRVFHWKAGQKTPIQILFRARAVADHVFASRDENMITRQALLPLFFAGCELRDISTRRKMIQYCKTWGSKTRYHMFYTTVPLLQQVWAEQEEKGFESVWWGQIVDTQHAAEPDGPLQRRLCFG